MEEVRPSDKWLRDLDGRVVGAGHELVGDCDDRVDPGVPGCLEVFGNLFQLNLVFLGLCLDYSTPSVLAGLDDYEPIRALIEMLTVGRDDLSPAFDFRTFADPLTDGCK